MAALQRIPAGYRETGAVDLEKDRRLSFWLNAAAGVAAVALFVLAHFLFVPVTELFGREESLWEVLLPALLIAGLLAYLVLHELTHAVFMRRLGAKQVRFGFNGIYAYAGSTENFFDRPSYAMIALAPLVVWGILFTVLLILVPRSWFWVIYVLQVSNLAGSCGDLYVSFRIFRMQESVLVRDTGIQMTFFEPEL